MQNFLKKLRKVPLIRRVCLCALLFGFTLNLLVHFSVAYLEYRDIRQNVVACLNQQIELTYDMLTEVVWKRDQESVTGTVSNIEQACSQSSENGHKVHWQVDLSEQVQWFERGSSLYRGASETLTIPISYWHEQVNGYGIGTLLVSVSFERAYQNVAADFWRSILLNGLVLVLSALLALVLGYVWFIKRSEEFHALAVSGKLDSLVGGGLVDEKTELSALWRVILRIRNESEQGLFEARKALEKTQQAYEQARKDVEAKNQFISSLSHDLRTPMNGLIGFSALLSESDLDETQKEYALTIQASLESLLHVINDVLDLSRIESGQLHVNSIPFNIRGVVSGVLSLLRARAHAKGIKLETRISSEIPPYLRGDPARIRQLLTNLVSNAIKYTNDGYVLINLEVPAKPGTDFVLRVSVEDTGLQIAQRGQSSAQLEQLGINHFSSELREKRSINLDASEKLAQLMGAHLFAQDAEGQGATYWFELTLPVVHGIAEGGVLDHRVLSEIYVIVLDSFELSRRITMELLQNWNISFDSASNLTAARELVELFQGDRYLLVLLDDRVQQPESFAAVRSLNSALGERGGIIVLSSYPQLGDAERYSLAGAIGFLNKQDRDPYLRDLICQVYIERHRNIGRDKRLVTRYTVQDLVENPTDLMPVWSVLIIEENIVNQQLIARALEQNDCRVDIATNGFEAIELFKSGRYDLIFMDCHMADMDGYETAQILCEIERSQKREAHTPMIAMLEHAFEGEEARCYGAGMNDVLHKPIKLSALKMVLQSHLS